VENRTYTQNILDTHSEMHPNCCTDCGSLQPILRCGADCVKRACSQEFRVFTQ